MSLLVCKQMLSKQQFSHVQHKSTLPSNQKGVALITVVMILILISLLGAMSMGLSYMNQRISQNSQASKLLKQSADIPTSVMLKPNNTSEINRYMNTFGPLGYLSNDGQDQSEYVFCYRPTKKQGVYEDNNYMIHLKTGGSLGKVSNGTGYCDLSSDSYTSSRGVVATQVSITRPNRQLKGSGDIDTIDEVPIEPFTNVIEGTDSNTSKIPPPVYYRTYTTSVLPTMAYASSDAKLKTCLQKTMGGLSKVTNATKTRDDLRSCLVKLDTPVAMQVQDFLYTAKIN